MPTNSEDKSVLSETITLHEHMNAEDIRDVLRSMSKIAGELVGRILIAHGPLGPGHQIVAAIYQAAANLDVARAGLEGPPQIVPVQARPVLGMKQ